MKEKNNIPFFNYQKLFQKDQINLESIFRDVSSRGAFIMQDDLVIFENSLAKYTGSKYAVGVANATDGLQLLLKAGGIGKGDEVIFCSHTMIATASAIKFTGATPIPAEAGVDHLIDPNSIERLITKKTKAIIPTQLNGRVANMEKIINIADNYGLQIYEDSAQALGAKFKGKMAGTFGLGGCISFYPAKILGCFGDGGAVLCNSEEIYNNIKLLRDHGRDEDGNISVWGYNSRLDNLQAAILSYFFQDFEKTISRRRILANLYNEKLKDVSEILLPPKPELNIDNYDVFQNYEIEAKRSEDLIAYLLKHGINTLRQWGGKAVHEYSDLGFKQSLPFTENLMRLSLMLPLNMFISDDEVNYVCEVIKDFYSINTY